MRWMWSRERTYQAVSWLNTIYPYKLLFNVVAFTFGFASIINDIWFDASWDILNISRIVYIELSLCLVVAPVISLAASRVKHPRSALYLSITADLSLMFGIFAYSMVGLAWFGLTFGVVIMWALSCSLAAYFVADIILLRLLRVHDVSEFESRLIGWLINGKTLRHHWPVSLPTHHRRW